MVYNFTQTFDVILGDFGRHASANYVRYLSEAEQTHLVAATGHQFFDESRQILFNLCCQIGWYKRDSIMKHIKRQGYLDKDILIGIGPKDIAEEFIFRATETVITNISFAVERHFPRIRIYTPCNGLTDLTREIVAQSVDSYAGKEQSVEILSNGFCHIENATKIEFCSLPEKVVRHFCLDERCKSILVLGTEGVNEIYRSECAKNNILVFPLDRRDYDLINDAIVASIGKNSSELRLAKHALEKETILRFRNNYGEGTIVEACTDFELGFGKSSLKIFAEEMVADVYG